MKINRISSESIRSKTASIVKKAAVPMTLIAGGISTSQFLKDPQETIERRNRISDFIESGNAIGGIRLNDILSPRENLETLQGLNRETVDRLMSANDKHGETVFNRNGIDGLNKVRKNCIPAYNYILTNAEFVDKIKNYSTNLFSSKDGIYAHATKGNTDITLDYTQHIKRDKFWSYGLKDNKLNIKEHDKENNILTEYKRTENEFGDFIEVKKSYDLSQNPPKLIEFETISGNKNNIKE